MNDKHDFIPQRHTQSYIYIFTRVPRRKNITYICTASEVKEEGKDRVLHIIWGFFYVSGEAIFMTFMQRECSMQETASLYFPPLEDS